ncbi:hypothetical protein [Nocardia sp. NPDC004711]
MGIYGDIEIAICGKDHTLACCVLPVGTEGERRRIAGQAVQLFYDLGYTLAADGPPCSTDAAVDILARGHSLTL